MHVPSRFHSCSTIDSGSYLMQYAFEDAALVFFLLNEGNVALFQGILRRLRIWLFKTYSRQARWILHVWQKNLGREQHSVHSRMKPSFLFVEWRNPCFFFDGTLRCLRSRLFKIFTRADKIDDTHRYERPHLTKRVFLCVYILRNGHSGRQA
jgi:hypothetical protein